MGRRKKHTKKHEQAEEGNPNLQSKVHFNKESKSPKKKTKKQVGSKRKQPLAAPSGLEELFQIGVDSSDESSSENAKSSLKASPVKKKKQKLRHPSIQQPPGMGEPKQTLKKDSAKSMNKTTVSKSSDEGRKATPDKFSPGLRVKTKKMKAKGYSFQYGTVVSHHSDSGRIGVRFDNKKLGEGNILLGSLTIVEVDSTITPTEEDLKSADEVKNSEDSEEDSDDEVDNKDSKVLTLKDFGVFKNSLLKETSSSGLRRLAKVFRACCRYSDSEAKHNARGGIRIASGDVFDACTKFCLENAPSLFNKVLGVTKASLESTKNVSTLTSNPKWISIAAPVRSYISNLHTLLSVATDPSMIQSILTNTIDIIRYIGPFPKHSTKFFKLFLRLWSEGNKNVRNEAFFALRGMAITLPDPFLETVVKQMYLSYVRNAKFTNEATLPTISFMANSVSEIIGLDLTSGYQQAFVNIRQLAIQLRSAITAKNAKEKTKRDRGQDVYTWQFINSLRLWTKVLCTHGRSKDDELYPLVYPLVQIILGVIQVRPTSRFFPLRMHCVRFLNEISEATRVYIPTAPHIIEMFQCAELSKNFKPSSDNPPDLKYILHVANQTLRAKQFQDVLVTTAMELLLKYFDIYSYSVAFPEHIIPILMYLKEFKKKTKVTRFKKLVTDCLQLLNENSNWIKGKRSDVKFAPKDATEVDAFLSEEKRVGKNLSPLDRYFAKKYHHSPIAAPQKGKKKRETKTAKQQKDNAPPKKKQKVHGDNTKEILTSEAQSEPSMLSESSDSSSGEDSSEDSGSEEPSSGPSSEPSSGPSDESKGKDSDKKEKADVIQDDDVEMDGAEDDDDDDDLVEDFVFSASEDESEDEMHMAVKDEEMSGSDEDQEGEEISGDSDESEEMSE